MTSLILSRSFAVIGPDCPGDEMIMTLNISQDSVMGNVQKTSPE
jgi:hypothetical protein